MLNNEGGTLEKPKRTPHKPARGTKIEWATHTAGRLLDGRTWDEFPGEVRGA